MLVESRIVDGKIIAYDKEQVSIDRIRAFEPEDGYFVADSGGKDSSVAVKLAELAGVKHEDHYSLTTVDPPELVRFIKEHHPETIIDYPTETMWQLIVRKGTPPLRMSRYCCSSLKESNGKGKVVITGVRWAESVRRKKNRHLVDIGSKKNTGIVYNDDNDEARKTVENCYRTRTTLINPIIDWLDEDVWEFIRKYNLPYCELYDHGYKRLGCIGCPMGGYKGMVRDFDRWPKYQQIYINTFQRMIDKRIADGKKTEWKTGQECFDWWIGKAQADEQMEGQVDFDDYT